MCLVLTVYGVMINVEASTTNDTQIQTTSLDSFEEVEKVTVLEADKLTTDSIMNGLIQIGNETEFVEKEEPVTYAKITTYGTDCYGCYNTNGYGGTAGGVKLSFDSVRQSDGSWKQGITYDGYYVVAANSSIPFGSIIEVSNHGYSGYGLVEGQPFYAMVLDRGAMTLNHLDLFVGSENNNSISINRSYNPTMKVVRYGY